MLGMSTEKGSGSYGCSVPQNEEMSEVWTMDEVQSITMHCILEIYHLLRIKKRESQVARSVH